jgi:hypothetical protein
MLKKSSIQLGKGALENSSVRVLLASPYSLV